jgi:hypothetical protein
MNLVDALQPLLIIMTGQITLCVGIIGPVDAALVSKKTLS